MLCDLLVTSTVRLCFYVYFADQLYILRAVGFSAGRSVPVVPSPSAGVTDCAACRRGDCRAYPRLLLLRAADVAHDRTSCDMLRNYAILAAKKSTYVSAS